MHLHILILRPGNFLLMFVEILCSMMYNVGEFKL